MPQTLHLLGLDLAVPDHSTLSRRAETLEVPRPASGPRGEPVHLLVDSTGLKLCGAGEWLAEKHGTSKRRSWRKLHIGMDAGTGQIVAAVLTDKDADDGSQVGPLLDQVAAPVVSFTADGAYDQEGVAAAVAARHPEAAVIVPPRSHGRAKRDGRDRANAAGPPPAVHRRARTSGLAEGVWLQHPSPRRSHYRQVQTGDR